MSYIENNTFDFLAAPACIIIEKQVEGIRMSRMYTQEEFDAEILAHQNRAPFADSIEGRLLRLDKKMDSHFRWVMGFLIGLYPLTIAIIIALISL